MMYTPLIVTLFVSSDQKPIVLQAHQRVDTIWWTRSYDPSTETCWGL